MSFIKNVLKQFLEEGIIQGKIRISQSVYKIRLKSDTIKYAKFTPGYFLRIAIGLSNDDSSMKDFVRSYSVWNIDRINGTIDLAIATLSNGSGAKWIEEIQIGEKVFFSWKKGNFTIDNNADSYLFIGDLSALSHLYIINRNLSKNKQIQSIIYSQNKDDFYADIDGTKPFNFYKMPQNPYKQIINKVNEIMPKMTGVKIVYIAGDSRLCLALNKYFKHKLLWDAKQMKIKPFWNPDKKGLE